VRDLLAALCLDGRIGADRLHAAGLRVRGVFVVFGLVAVSGWVAGLVGGTPETSERLLEDIAP